MRNEAAIDRLIGDVYEAALDDTLWPAIGTRLARNFHANSALIQVQEAHGATLLVTEGAAAGYCDAAYRAYYWQRDLWVRKGMEIGFGHILTSRDMGTEAAFARTEFYTDVCRKLDVFHVLGTAMKLEHGQAAAVSVHRPLRSGCFDAGEVALFARMAPHLARALRIRMRLAQLDVPDCHAGRTPDRGKECPAASPASLRGAFGLTPAEARIAGALAEGLALADIARACGISLHTARAHLKHILGKTGTTRQAQLVALVHRTIAARKSDV